MPQGNPFPGLAVASIIGLFALALAAVLLGGDPNAFTGLFVGLFGGLALCAVVYEGVIATS